MEKIQFMGNMVEGNGRTVKENNEELIHNIPVGSLVEVKHQEWHGGGACEKIHGRYFVYSHNRDCDGTPLYTLCPRKKTPEGLPNDFMVTELKYPEKVVEMFCYGLVRGLPEESLTVIEQTQDIIDGKDSLQWNDDWAHEYKPETKFQLSEDGKLVYNLHQDGWDKGYPLMVNDCYITIQGNHLSDEIKKEIMETVCYALNEKYHNGGI